MKFRRDLVGRAERRVDHHVALVIAGHRVLLEIELVLGPEVRRDAQLAEPPLEQHLGLELDLAIVLRELAVEADVDRPLARIGEALLDAIRFGQPSGSAARART